MKIIHEKTKENPIEVFERGLAKIMPELELKTRRVGGSNYSVPTEVNSKRKMALSIK